MPLPLPHILSHAIAAVDTDTRETLRLFEALVGCLESAVKHNLMFRRDVALEFPQIVASYAQSSLQRVRLTSWGVISALNAPNEVLFVMAIRSLLESAANIAYLRTNLQKTYAGEMPRKEMTYLSLRMKFATRKPGDFDLGDDAANRVTSVNVLTAIKALDRFAVSDLGFANDRAMSTWYERLCEFSHPNCLGNSVGSELDYAKGRETFELDPSVRPEVLSMFSNYAYVVLYAFCLIFNGCWRIINDAGEAVPAWEPPGAPVIAIR